MAKGDFTPVCLLQKVLTATATENVISGAAGKRRYITAIIVLNTGTSERVVSVYAYGSAAGNACNRIDLEANGNTGLGDLPYFVNEGQSFYFKQDAGADVNILVMGREEALT